MQSTPIKIKSKKDLGIKYLCKFTGNKDHEYIEIKNDEDVIIQKVEEIDSNLIKTNWSFGLDRVYDENIDYEELYENEFSSLDYYSEIYKGFKSTFILIGKSSDSFCNSNDYAYTLLCKALNDVFSFKNLPYKYMKDKLCISLSYLDYNDGKLNDNFNFSQEILQKIKVIEIEDEIILDGLKEVSVKDLDQALQLIG